MCLRPGVASPYILDGTLRGLMNISTGHLDITNLDKGLAIGLYMALRMTLALRYCSVLIVTEHFPSRKWNLLRSNRIRWKQNPV